MRNRVNLNYCVLASLVCAVIDYYVLPRLGQAGFVMHNVLAFAMGAGLAGCSWQLLGQRPARSSILVINVFIGASMMIVHVVLLIWKCRA